MHRWTAGAAGATGQGLNPGRATIRSLDRTPAIAPSAPRPVILDRPYRRSGRMSATVHQPRGGDDHGRTTGDLHVTEEQLAAARRRRAGRRRARRGGAPGVRRLRTGGSRGGRDAVRTGDGPGAPGRDPPHLSVQERGPEGGTNGGAEGNGQRGAGGGVLTHPRHIPHVPPRSTE